MIAYYNCRPGKPARLSAANLPRRNVRWQVQVNRNGRKSLLAEDAADIANTLRRDSSQTLKGIAHELGVSPEFLKAMLAAHGEMLRFFYKAG